MASINKKITTTPVYTHEGAKAVNVNNYLQLKRSSVSTMLWEGQFYEDGQEIAKRIESLIPNVDPAKVAELTIDIRTKYKNRHMPIYIARIMAKLPSHKRYVSDLLSNVIQRADELTEFLALYWKDNKDQPLSAQVKKGLAKAFCKFDEYQLAKYNRDHAIKLRDVLFLCHAKPKDENQELLWKKLIGGYCKNCWTNHYDKITKKVNTSTPTCSRFEEAKLTIPDTWETALSGGANKNETFTRLLTERKLGGLALLRNLRNMVQANVDRNLIKRSIENIKTERILPYRFISAANYGKEFEKELEIAMFKCLDGYEKLNGNTLILVDVSGSMDAKVSDKSEITRLDAAEGLAMLSREICNNTHVFTFSNRLVEIPSYSRGFTLKNDIHKSQSHGGTELGKALEELYRRTKFDRIIVITDEQSHDSVPAPPKGSKGYMINVASYKYGVGYGSWCHIDGWSEAVIDYILELEKLEV